MQLVFKLHVLHKRCICLLIKSNSTTNYINYILHTHEHHDSTCGWFNDNGQWWWQMTAMDTGQKSIINPWMLALQFNHKLLGWIWGRNCTICLLTESPNFHLHRKCRKLFRACPFAIDSRHHVCVTMVDWNHHHCYLVLAHEPPWSIDPHAEPYGKNNSLFDVGNHKRLLSSISLFD